MGRREKLFITIRNNPKNVRFEDVDRLLVWAGFECRQPKGGSSHFVYRKAGCPLLTVPYRKPLLACYVKKALLYIEEYGDFEL